jgi:hypothetical protein
VWDEESGELHRELEPLGLFRLTALASFLSADGQQARLVAGSSNGQLRIYDPEAGSMLHRLGAHVSYIADLACIASSPAATSRPRLVSTSYDGTAKVWDGETREWLADLRGHEGPVTAVAVWKEHTGNHDRIATTGFDGHVRVWDGEAFTLLHDLEGASANKHVLPFQTAEGPYRLLVVPVSLHGGRGMEVYDPEEGRLLQGDINRDCPMDNLHLFESAQGRHLLALRGEGNSHTRHPDQRRGAFLDVWDLGEAPAGEGHVRGAHKHG